MFILDFVCFINKGFCVRDCSGKLLLKCAAFCETILKNKNGELNQQNLQRKARRRLLQTGRSHVELVETFVTASPALRQAQCDSSTFDKCAGTPN